MTIRVAINGFGRIGRLMARLLIEKTGGGDVLRLRAIVVRKGKGNDLEKRASLLRRDSVHGSFKGTIPYAIRSLLGLRTLDLGDNFLSGTIPSRLADLPLLTRLDISLNKFTGPLPIGLIRPLRSRCRGSPGGSSASSGRQ